MYIIIVPTGQPIPPGLHVRMNLQTGVTEAKLMDNDDDKTSKDSAVIAVGPHSDIINEKQETVEAKVVQTPQHVDGVHVMSSEDGERTVFANGKLTPQQLQEALQNLDFEDVEVASEEVKYLSFSFFIFYLKIYLCGNGVHLCYRDNSLLE